MVSVVLDLEISQLKFVQSPEGLVHSPVYFDIRCPNCEGKKSMKVFSTGFTDHVMARWEILTRLHEQSG